MYFKGYHRSEDCIFRSKSIGIWTMKAYLHRISNYKPEDSNCDLNTIFECTTFNLFLVTFRKDPFGVMNGDNRCTCIYVWLKCIKPFQIRTLLKLPQQKRKISINLILYFPTILHFLYDLWGRVCVLILGNVYTFLGLKLRRCHR